MKPRRRIDTSESLTKGLQFGSFETKTRSGVKVQVNATKHLRVGHDIDLELADQPGLYSWYGELRDDAAEHLKRANKAVTALTAELDEELRQDKMTETQLKRLIASHSRMIEAQKAVDYWDYRHTRLKTLREDMQERGRNVSALAANLRADLSKTNSDSDK